MMYAGGESSDTSLALQGLKLIAKNKSILLLVSFNVYHAKRNHEQRQINCRSWQLNVIGLYTQSIILILQGYTYKYRPLYALSPFTMEFFLIMTPTILLS